MSLILFRIAAVLLAVGTVAHTLGGMLGTAKRGPGAGAEADEVLRSMKSARFNWRGSETSWFDFWMGNGLGLSALLAFQVVVLWVVGALPGALPIAWAAFASLAVLAWLGVKHFATRVGVVFGLVALLTGIAAGVATFG